MSTKAIFFCIKVFIILSGCYYDDPSSEIVEGVVNYIFLKDTLGHERYWLVEKKFRGLHFEEDVSGYVSEIYLTCEGFDVQISEDRITVYDLPQYQNQNLEVKNYDKHYGGELFEFDGGYISLTFQMKAEVIKLDSQPCSSFYFQSKYSCPVERKPVEYPVYLIANVIEAKSLGEDIIGEKRMNRYPGKDFLLGTCN